MKGQRIYVLIWREKIKQLEDAIARLDETRRMLEINLMSQLSLQERKIKEQEKAISELGKTKRYNDSSVLTLGDIWLPYV